MTKKTKRHVMVLLSGGLDSAACIHYFRKLGFNVECLFVNYGQKSLKGEREAVSRISKHFKVKTKEYKVVTGIREINGVIQGRNNLFVAVALMNFDKPHGAIGLGIHAGTKYPDCASQFVLSIQAILDIYTNGNVSLDCPFIKMSKEEIVQYCKKSKIPFKLTYSCEKGSKIPCGKCDKCIELKAIYESEGIKG